MQKDDKYGNDEDHEAWFDTHIFCPIASLLVDPLYKLNLTPNIITLLSTLCSLISVYFFHINIKYIFISLFIFGYLLDCVDGKMARRYNMGSNFGMIFDLVSDNISNIILLLYIIFNYFSFKNFNNIVIIIIINILIIMMIISYGLNEAKVAYNKIGSDNFYIMRKNQLDNTFFIWYENILYKIFLLINKISYFMYKKILLSIKTTFINLNKENDNHIMKINYWLNILKHFGPGNYTVILMFLLLCLD